MKTTAAYIAMGACALPCASPFVVHGGAVAHSRSNHPGYVQTNFDSKTLRRSTMRFDDLNDSFFPPNHVESTAHEETTRESSQASRSSSNRWEPTEVQLSHPDFPHTAAPLQQSSGLLDPRVIGAIMDLAGPDDPTLAEFFEDFTSSGPMASMHHLGRPGVASRLSALMGEVTAQGRPSSAPRAAPGNSGWGRRGF
jgi:hypothetical protein